MTEKTKKEFAAVFLQNYRPCYDAAAYAEMAWNEARTFYAKPLANILQMLIDDVIHCQTFICTKEKMHPCGQQIIKLDVKRAEMLLKHFTGEKNGNG